VKEADDHRTRAAFCISLAATTDDEVTKGALIEMAQKWRELADRSDLAEPPPSPRRTGAGNGSKPVPVRAKRRMTN
jgi:hypothetical protein